jgi:GT2 family glycosyltransferase
MKDEHVDPRVAIIVLNWNGWENSIECLESIYKIDYPNYDLILVDNASDDDSIEKIRGYCGGRIEVESNYVNYTHQNKPINIKEIDHHEMMEIELEDVKGLKNRKNLLFIKNDQNYGFAEGNNIAIRFAMEKLDPEYVLLLNNDTVVDNKFLNELIHVATKNEKIGFVGPKIYYYTPDEISKIVNFAGGNLNRNTFQPHPRGGDQLDKGQFDTELMVDYVEGSCLLVKNDLINTVGLLDPEYFTYWEEMDWCIRGQMAGYDSLYAPNAIIWHKGRASDLSANSIYYMIKNRFLFIKKNAQPVQILSSTIYYFGYYFWIILFSVALVNRDGNKKRSFLKGTYDGLKILINH